MNQRSARGRELRFFAPPFNADQWVAEAVDVDLPADPGDVFTPAVPINGQFAVPTNHQGVVLSIRVSAIVTIPVGSDGRDLVWSLLRNGSPVPGYENRVLHGEVIEVAAHTVDVESHTIAFPAVNYNGTIAGVLIAVGPAPLCSVGCDLVLTDGEGGFVLLTAMTRDAFNATVAAHGHQVPSYFNKAVLYGMPDGVLVPVWLNEGDVLRLLVRAAGALAPLSLNVSLGGAIWPIPSDSSAGLG